MLEYDDNSEQMEHAYNMTNNRFQREWLKEAENIIPVSLQPYYVIFPSGRVADNADEMLGFLRYFRAYSMDNPENHVNVIDENSVAARIECLDDGGEQGESVAPVDLFGTYQKVCLS
ncbi:MAG: hypothetical protein K2N44_16875 [Lachnospiraceae bacterium]|nr:hypothetical protein [Lachnospiraceae bacterium]